MFDESEWNIRLISNLTVLSSSHRREREGADLVWFGTE